MMMTDFHTVEAKVAVGGYLDDGTCDKPYLKIFVCNALSFIDLDSLGAVESDQFRMVMNSGTALLLSRGKEMHTYLKASIAAMEDIRNGESPNAKYGLPRSVYGVTVVVDDTMPDRTVCIKVNGDDRYGYLLTGATSE